MVQAHGATTVKPRSGCSSQCPLAFTGTDCHRCTVWSSCRTGFSMIRLHSVLVDIKSRTYLIPNENTMNKSCYLTWYGSKNLMDIWSFKGIVHGKTNAQDSNPHVVPNTVFSCKTEKEKIWWINRNRSFQVSNKIKNLFKNSDYMASGYPKPHKVFVWWTD